MRHYRTGFALAVLLASTSAFAETPGWVVSESSGKVAIVSTGISRVAIRGGQLVAGDFVTTGATGRAVLVRGEEYLVVAPSTRIRIAEPAKSGGFTQIVEHFGNVIYKIKKMTMPHFAVETPFLAAVVKGTTFSVTVTEKGAAVQVVEGRVEVATRDRGAAFMVLPGDIGSVRADALRTLKVQGRENRNIESTVAAGAAPVVEPIAAVLDDGDTPGGVNADQHDTLVVEAVSEGPVRLSGLTGGLVEGDSSLAGLIATSARGTPRSDAQAIAQLSGGSNETTPLPPVAVAESTDPAVSTAAVASGSVPAVITGGSPTVSVAAITSCAGVPNCNGSTYTGPSNVANGSGCNGVASCDGGAFNVNVNGNATPTPVASTTTVSLVVSTPSVPVVTQATPVGPVAAVVSSPVIVVASVSTATNGSGSVSSNSETGNSGENHSGNGKGNNGNGNGNGGNNASNTVTNNLQNLVKYLKSITPKPGR